MIEYAHTEYCCRIIQGASMQNPKNPDLPTNPKPGENPTEIPDVPPKKTPNPKDNPIAKDNTSGFIDKFMEIWKNDYRFK